VELPGPGGSLRQTAVADGLEFPRGLAVTGNRLYVTELRSLPCDPPYPICEGPSVGPTAAEGERTIIREARGRISSYAIDANGGLSGKVVLLDDLPVAGSQHGVNGIAVAPDGDLYASVGHHDFVRYEPIGRDLTPHPEWFGTILRIDPTSGAADVFARGLRNVYGLTFDSQGGLWGVDNDGPAGNGWRLEEVLQIKEARRYGFPQDGTFGPWTDRDDGPVWVLDNTGTAGILWAEEAGMPPGVFVGDCGSLKHLALFELDDRWSTKDPVTEGQTLTDLLEIQGCVTDLAAVGPRTIVAAVFNYDGGGELLRLTIEDGSA
jgi:hypothetical protein